MLFLINSLNIYIYQESIMDIDDAFSSDSEQQNHSLNSEGRETITTESHRLDKTKNIKKKYQPIMDGGKIYRFQDNPSQYKKLRKKIQNRESATRVRGRKKNAFQNLEQEVQYLRKENSQLQLANAKLQTENKSFKDQIQFMKTLIKPANKGNDPVQAYLSSQVLSHPSSQASQSPQSQPNTVNDQFESPFFQDFNWMRSESSSSNLGWLGIAIFTIVLGVFVVPDTNSTSQSFSALQVNGLTQVTNPSIPITSIFSTVLYYGKSVLKYGIILVYLWIIFTKVDGYLKRRKLKKV